VLPHRCSFRRVLGAFVLAFALMPAAPVRAEADAPARSRGAATGAKVPAAPPLLIPRVTTAPKIDGVLDPGLYEKEFLRMDKFVQLAPKANEPATFATVAYAGHDDKNIYFAFRCEDPAAGQLRASVTNRDGALDDDWVIIFIDTFNEKRRAATFAVNPRGVEMDFIRIEEGGNDNMDSSWDTVWEAEAKTDAGGYTVEMAIPFKSLRFPDQEQKIWGLTLGRNVPRTGEVDLWPSFSRDIPGLLSQSGQILIRGRVEKGNNLEIMPVVTALKLEGEKLDVQPGANIKYGLNSNLTLDAAINPDFSQVEADAPQIDVNLRYALRYQEKRPFFLEGMEIFGFPEIEMVYTRRIADPLWGAKVSGKLGKFAYGILSAYDEHPTESVWDVHNTGGGENQKALFNVVRLKTDIFNQGSYLGFCLADKEAGDSWNRVAGVDGQWRFADKFFFNFQALASKTDYGGTQTDFAPALYAEAYYFTKNFSAGGFWKSIHPDFEASTGFVNRSDYRNAGAFVNVRLYPDKPFLNQVQFRLQAGQRDAYFSNVVQDTWVRANTQLRFTEFNQLVIEAQSGRELFAGTDFHKTTFNLQGQSNIIKWLPFNLYAQIGDSINYDSEDPFLGWGVTVGVGVNIKPSSRLQLGVDFAKETFWRTRGGERLWDYNVFHTRTIYQLTRSLSVRAIVDYNHFYKQIFGNLLLSYVLRPGTVFFLGFDSNYDRNAFGRYDRRNTNIFVKFSYWWRV
jgi:hypothetical protein